MKKVTKKKSHLECNGVEVFTYTAGQLHRKFCQGGAAYSRQNPLFPGYSATGYRTAACRYECRM